MKNENCDDTFCRFVLPRVNTISWLHVAWNVQLLRFIGALLPLFQKAELDAQKSQSGQYIIFFWLYIPYAV